jgi:hypothetical protein
MRVHWRLSTARAAQIVHALATGTDRRCTAIAALPAGGFGFDMDLRPFSESATVYYLGLLSRLNVRLLEEALGAGRPLPLLYESGVRYTPELGRELWTDLALVQAIGEEDCDSLAPARAAELVVYGSGALWPHMPGWDRARALGLKSIRAEVVMEAPADHPVDRAGTYHAVVQYEVDGQIYTDDPSLRLGMHGELDSAVRLSEAFGPLRSRARRPKRWASARSRRGARAACVGPGNDRGRVSQGPRSAGQEGDQSPSSSP